MGSFKVILNALYFVFGYAWEREKDKKYYEYGLTIDPGYSSSFNYNLDKNAALYFKDDTKKLILTKYKEQGLSDRFKLLSKLDIQRICSDLIINKEEKNEAINNSSIPLNNFRGKMSFVGVDYEIRIRALLFKKDDQHLSIDSRLGFPAAIHGEGGTDIANPTFKFGISYARNFDFKFLKNNFYEIMLATRVNPNIKNKDLFVTLNLGLRFADDILVMLSFENNHLYKNSYERYEFTSIYKKVSTKGLTDEQKEKLKSHIEHHSLLNAKKIERKINTKFIYTIDDKYSIAFDYAYRFAKNINPHLIKFSLIKYLQFHYLVFL
jgi:hypothetical protein